MLFMFAAVSFAVEGSVFNQYTLDEARTMFNSNRGEMPSPITDIINGERINIHIQGQGNYYIIMNGEYMAELARGELSDQTLNVYTDKQTVERIADGELSPTQALEANLITYEGVGFVSGVKFWTTQVLFDVSSFLGLF